MKYQLLDTETTTVSIHHGHDSGSHQITVQKRFAPADGDGDVYTEQRPTGSRRRFLIETVTVRWTLSSEDPAVRTSVAIEGRTVLANGAVSPRSTGYARFWPDQQLPDTIAELLDAHNPHLTDTTVGALLKP
ncbi:hypothetical protein EB74_08655 [Mycobacterium sp. SWH-M5]|nr:hypothetical protein EB74_08655 [Mycobacterium sp. SWH-M5]